MWIYKVQWYCESIGDRIVTSGIVTGSSMTKASEQIVKHYGESNVINLTLFMVMDATEQIYEFERDTDWTQVFETDISSEF